QYNYEFLLVKDVGDGVFHVQLNRPKKTNALNSVIWNEIGDVFTKLDRDDVCRAVVLSGNERTFTTGIDLTAFSQVLAPEDGLDTARKGRQVRNRDLSSVFVLPPSQRCCKPVVAAVHGYCYVQEVDVGLAADMGTLNRLPKVIGNHSWMRDVSLTARHFGAAEAKEYGKSLNGTTQKSKTGSLLETAKCIATNSPVAVQGTKVVLNYSRDHPVDLSLKFVAMWNMSQLQTDDIAESAMAVMTKGPKPVYAKL
ncbi:hypothetical protein PFISCL1PPCAC_13219, partial [Pristionchus fissidentatus]